MKRNCTNCVFCTRFKYSPKDETEMMRCWQEPSAYDHAFVRSMHEAEDCVCDEHRTKEEREKELFEEAKEYYLCCKKHIKTLEEKYPSLKDLAFYE